MFKLSTKRSESKFQFRSWAYGLLAIGIALGLAAPSFAADDWVEGQNYFVISPAQPTSVSPGKVEVVEVFSYGCPACFAFYPAADKLKKSLPKNAEMRYVPASWNPSEQWPLFQQAYLTAKALGVANKAHDAMFNAIWSSDELAVVDHATNTPKRPPPNLEKVAAFYARVTGVDKAKFIAVAKSFSIATEMKVADAAVRAYRAESTPTFVVNGKYRVTPQSAGSEAKLIELVDWLVAKESK